MIAILNAQNVLRWKKIENKRGFNNQYHTYKWNQFINHQNSFKLISFKQKTFKNNSPKRGITDPSVFNFPSYGCS